MPPKGKDAKGGKAKEKSGGDEGGSKGKGGKGAKGGGGGDLGTCTFVKGKEICQLSRSLHSEFVEYKKKQFFSFVSTLTGSHTCET